jgi:hypothetical protein
VGGVSFLGGSRTIINEVVLCVGRPTSATKGVELFAWGSQSFIGGRVSSVGD